MVFGQEFDWTLWNKSWCCQNALSTFDFFVVLKLRAAFSWMEGISLSLWKPILLIRLWNGFSYLLDTLSCKMIISKMIHSISVTHTFERIHASNHKKIKFFFPFLTSVVWWIITIIKQEAVVYLGIFLSFKCLSVCKIHVASSLFWSILLCSAHNLLSRLSGWR